MSKKHKKPTPAAEPRKYDNTLRQELNIAGPCQGCKARLAQCDPPRPQKTRIYAMRNGVRYCRCDNCGNTWKRSI